MVRRADFRPARERINALPAERRAKIEAGARKLIEAAHIGELRKALDVTQAVLAERSGMKQAEISRIERAPETAKLMTVERYVESLGGSLKLVADFPDGTRAEIGMRRGQPVKSRIKANVMEPQITPGNAALLFFVTSNELVRVRHFHE